MCHIHEDLRLQPHRYEICISDYKHLSSSNFVYLEIKISEYKEFTYKKVRISEPLAYAVIYLKMLSTTQNYNMVKRKCVKYNLRFYCCKTQIAKRVHIVLTSLVAPVLGYEISAPQDTLDIKKSLKVFSCKDFFLGDFSSAQSSTLEHR